MDSKEFATINAGKIFMCPAGFAPYINTDRAIEPLYLCKVVGYSMYKSDVVVSFSDADMYNATWEMGLRDCTATVSPDDLGTRGWFVPHSELVPFKEPAVVSVNLYNTACLRCNFPSRKTKQIVVCSNGRCASNKKLIKSMYLAKSI